MNKTKHLTKFPTFRTNGEDQDEEYVAHESSLGYFVKSKVSNQFTVNLDEAVIEAKYYRGVVSMLMEATEDDNVVFLINSPGGRYSGLVALLEALKMSDATTCAVIVGECHSAASIFALHCDQVFVSDNAEMLCHQISYSAGGKGSDILSHVQHVAKISEKLLRSTYEHFLSEKEIDEMLSGREVYLDSEDIKQRLDCKVKAMEEKFEKQAADSEPEVPVLDTPLLEDNLTVLKPKRKR